MGELFGHHGEPIEQIVAFAADSLELAAQDLELPGAAPRLSAGRNAGMDPTPAAWRGNVAHGNGRWPLTIHDYLDLRGGSELPPGASKGSD